MTPEQLAEHIRVAISELIDAGKLVGELPQQVSVERPKNRDHGDWATNAAMQLAAKFGTNPRAFAELLVGKLAGAPGIAEVSIAGPGFLNIRLQAGAAAELVTEVLKQGRQYGTGKVLAGLSFNVEFVSANPTGPVHLGGTRWAAVGDSLARIIESQGARVVREYYFNDHGVQIDRFARSLLARAKGEPAPEDGYGGQYIEEIAASVVEKFAGDWRGLPEAEAQELFRAVGVELMFEQIKATLHDFGVDFDVYFHENSLYESGEVERAIARLRELGHIFEAEGATWLRSSTFGDDRDRVVLKSDGTAAYIAGDLAYYSNKRGRGFDRCIYLLGADHHGYVPRLMALCAALGDQPGVNMEILIGQMVNLVRDGEPVRMSKRAGTVVTLEDLVDLVGVDAARYALVRSSINSSLDIDVELLSKKTNDNPVFYVQYAHARTVQVTRNAADFGVTGSDFDPALLTHPAEEQLLARLAEYPRMLAQAAEFREPHRIARFLEDLAGDYHRWYDNCRVTPMPTEPITALNHTRLQLNVAAGQVLRNGLELLGVGAPDRM